MSYFIGIDGGGTKTALCCMDKKGKILATEDTRGTSYRQWGIDAVCTTLEEGVAALTKKAGIPLTAVAGIAMGAPCFGESQEGDRMLTQAVTRLFAPLAVLVVNDSAVGWAGSLALEEGINVVAGTGSIAFGRNSAGKTARCGGRCQRPQHLPAGGGGAGTFGQEGQECNFARESLRTH